ncbi:MAG: hypothetical protein EOM37_09085 [Proteobacteria bacterium]|nr:hypothetical protein [Pseudomonadota bacterium]
MTRNPNSRKARKEKDMTKQRNMRFAFDVDGVISEMPELFAALTSALKLAGHEILIVTDFDESFRKFREEELTSLGIVYDELIITPQKEKIFLERGVDFAFDDDVEYYENLKKLGVFVFGKPSG